jgi:hypothetical protein
MSTELEIIAVEKYCNSNNVEIEFVHALHAVGLIEIVQSDNLENLYLEELSKLERFSRLHYELQVNVEGIDIIDSLLSKLASLQNDYQYLQSKLSLYE